MSGIKTEESELYAEEIWPHNAYFASKLETIRFGDNDPIKVIEFGTLEDEPQEYELDCDILFDNNIHLTAIDARNIAKLLNKMADELEKG